MQYGKFQSLAGHAAGATEWPGMHSAALPHHPHPFFAIAMQPSHDIASLHLSFSSGFASAEREVTALEEEHCRARTRILGPASSGSVDPADASALSSARLVDFSSAFVVAPVASS